MIYPLRKIIFSSLWGKGIYLLKKPYFSKSCNKGANMRKTARFLLLLSIASAFLLSFPAYGQKRIRIQLLSATVKNKVIPGAQVIFQKDGEQSVRLTSDSQGKVDIPAPFSGKDDSSMLMIVKKAGYSNLVVKCPCDDMAYALSSKMKQLDGMRIVLNWGKHPSDLDSHLSFPGNHVYFSKKKGNRSNLDVDDTTSYGPETITIDKKFHGQKYVYAVHDFSNHSRSGEPQAMSHSRAKVLVYIGSSLIKSYYIKPNTKGTLWILFGIDEYGEFHDINQYTTASSSNRVNEILQTIVNKENFDPAPITPQHLVNRAKALNGKGEKAYHKKRYEKAIQLYREAIDLYPEYGQAYSNLGLAYQRNRNVAEAIWANRKAIALAEGNTKKRVQASSYYNIARIYESQGRWEEAKQNFEWALERRNHKAYRNGIARMKKKLNIR